MDQKCQLAKDRLSPRMLESQVAAAVVVLRLMPGTVDIQAISFQGVGPREALECVRQLTCKSVPNGTAIDRKAMEIHAH